MYTEGLVIFVPLFKFSDQYRLLDIERTGDALEILEDFAWFGKMNELKLRRLYEGLGKCASVGDFCKKWYWPHQEGVKEFRDVVEVVRLWIQAGART